MGKVFGPLTIYAYHLAAILAICYLIPAAKPRSSDFVLPGILVAAVLWSTATGFATGNPDLTVTREATTMIEMAIGFVLAMFVVYSGHVRWSIRVMIVILWFSAAMAIISSLYAIRLAGRAESLRGRRVPVRPCASSCPPRRRPPRC